MSEVRVPVKTMLRETTTPASVIRMWGRIEARGRSLPQSRVGRTRILVLAAALVASTVFAFVRPFAQPRPPSPSPVTRPSTLAPMPSIASSPSPLASAAPGRSPPTSSEGAARPAAPAVESVTAHPAPASPSVPVVRSAGDAEAWRELAARGQNARAYAELGRDGIATKAETASVEDLLALADVARLSGHEGDAVVPLRRVVTEHRSDARASLAALTLARVQLRSLGLPADAAASLDTAIALGLPVGLEEGADALLIESRARAGDCEGARAAYERYVQRFPAGSERTEMERWARGP